jgi:release factor glutamine methyltransferase
VDELDVIQAALSRGYAEFMGQEFLVEPGVLVPRAVTEVLIRAYRAVLGDTEPQRIVDLGCGCGMIGITLALVYPRAHVVGLDIAADAVRVTRRNIEKFGLTERMEARLSNMFEAIPALAGCVDAIVSSPPFISSGQLAKGSAHLLAQEPRTAFDAGPYGIAIHQRLIIDSAKMLRQGSGWLVVEFGEGQDKQVAHLIERSGSYQNLNTFRERTNRFVASIAVQRSRQL